MQKISCLCALAGGIMLMAGTGSLVNASPAKAIKAVENYVAEKTKFSGTLDLYDEQLDDVRQLRFMEYLEGGEQPEGESVVDIKYRDVNSGDIVTVSAQMIVTDGEYAVEDLVIANVEPLQAAKPEKTEYTAEEIQAKMREYLESQAKFTGFVMIFDKDVETLRKLKLLKLDEEVRELGVLRISRAWFTDTETGEKIGVDITMENRDGNVKVKNLIIRERKPAE